MVGRIRVKTIQTKNKVDFLDRNMQLLQKIIGGVYAFGLCRLNEVYSDCLQELSFLFDSRCTVLYIVNRVFCCA